MPNSAGKSAKVVFVTALVTVMLWFSIIVSPLYSGYSPSTMVLLCARVISVAFGILLVIGYAYSQTLERHSPGYKAWQAFHSLALVALMSIFDVVLFLFGNSHRDLVRAGFVILFLSLYACLTLLLAWRVYQCRVSNRSERPHSTTNTA